MDSLPKPMVLGSSVEPDEAPAMPVMLLKWDPEKVGTAERLWYLPRHVTLMGSAPERFGMTIIRRDKDTYALRLLWNDMRFAWSELTRVQLLTSALTPLLRVLGQDLWQLLNQPVHSVTVHPRVA
jgi:hypothetical protein